jgi:hypothetical protein
MKIALFLLSFVFTWIGLSSDASSINSLIREEKIEDTVTFQGEQEPGILIRGRVVTGCDGLANVNIFQSFSAYPGELIATTDSNGYYKSEFIYVPFDEMVGVWAVRNGYSFEPENYFWRHYAGYREYTLNFSAFGNSPTSDCFYLPLTIQAGH